jgi:hypothetical protein
MSKKMYRSAQGKSVDIGALTLQNENTKAVGNMGVNARGDMVNAQNDVIGSRSDKIKKHYRKQTRRTNVMDDSIPESRAKPAKVVTPVVQPEVAIDPEPVVEPVVEPAPVETKTKTDPVAGGLAGAIAKAKSVKQEPMKTPRQLAKEKAGVKKI